VLPITDLIAPALASRLPAAKATNIGLLPTITARFSEPVHGLSTGSMMLSSYADGVAVATTVAYDAATRTATLRPSARLLPLTTYRVSLSGSIKDAAGNSLSWTWWTFTTVASEVYVPPRTLAFTPGTFVGYRFNAAGFAYATKSYTLVSGSTAPTTKYAAIPGHPGGWFYVLSGVWQGYWIQGGSRITLR
jgi:hypothetical protein